MHHTNASNVKPVKQPRQPEGKSRRESEQERGKQWQRDDKRSRYA